MMRLLHKDKERCLKKGRFDIKSLCILCTIIVFNAAIIVQNSVLTSKNCPEIYK